MKNITNVRKVVVTLANKLNKKVKDLSASFIRAWQMIKAQIFLTSKVAGTTFQNRQKGLARLARYNPQLISVELIREVNADKNVTLNTYSHIIKSKEKQAANKMDNFYSRLHAGNHETQIN